jgi:ABC-type multidrug transport system fused ATPase/permease subunit
MASGECSLLHDCWKIMGIAPSLILSSEFSISSSHSKLFPLSFIKSLHNLQYYSSYPHGGWAALGLIASCVCALAATMWGMASCRFMYIDYITDRGDFSDFYRDPTADGDPVLQRVGAGLFTWLLPFGDNGDASESESTSDWTSGQCAGYSEGQRIFFSDNIFEVARIFAVLSVLGGMGVVFAVLFLSCISLRRFQIWMLSIILGLISMSTGLTFIVFQSKLCNDLVSYQKDDSYTTKCRIDQGGLVVIAAGLFWSVATLISIVYIKDPKRDIGIENGQITNAFESRQEQRYQREKERRMKSDMNREQRRSNQQQQQQQQQQREKESSSSPSSSRSSNDTKSTTNSARRSPPPNDYQYEDGEV